MKRTKLIYLFILCELLVLNIIYVRYWPVWLLIIVICFGILMFVKGAVQKRFVKVEVFKEVQAVNVKNTHTVRIRVSNSFFLPVTDAKLILELKEVDSDSFKKRTIEFDIREKKHTDIELTVDTSHIGSVQFAISGLYIFDDIKLFKHRVKCDCSNHIIYVMPRLLENLGLPASNNDFFEGDTFEENVSGDDPSEVFGIKEYVPGDKVNRIHWKISAKSEEILVKEYSKPEPMAPIIVVDKKECSLDENDRLMETLFSIIHSIVSMERDAVINYMGPDGVKSVHIEGFEDVYEGIKAVILGEVSTDNEVLKATFDQIQGYGSQDIYWITTTVEEEYRILLNEMKNVSTYVFAFEGEEEIINIKEWIIDEE